MADACNENTSTFKEENHTSNPYVSKEYSNHNKTMQQHPTIAEELEVAYETDDIFEVDRDFNLLQRPNIKNRLPDVEGGGLSTIIEDQTNKSRDEESYHTNGSFETHVSETLNNHSEHRNVSLGQRPLNIVPSSQCGS